MPVAMRQPRIGNVLNQLDLLCTSPISYITLMQQGTFQNKCPEKPENWQIFLRWWLIQRQRPNNQVLPQRISDASLQGAMALLNQL